MVNHICMVLLLNPSSNKKEVAKTLFMSSFLSRKKSLDTEKIKLSFELISFEQPIIDNPIKEQFIAFFVQNMLFHYINETVEKHEWTCDSSKSKNECAFRYVNSISKSSNEFVWCIDSREIENTITNEIIMGEITAIGNRAGIVLISFFQKNRAKKGRDTWKCSVFSISKKSKNKTQSFNLSNHTIMEKPNQTLIHPRIRDDCSNTVR